MQSFASNRSQFIAIACLLSGCTSTEPMHSPVESIQIQGFASDGVTPDPAKLLILQRQDIEAMVADSWPMDNYAVLAHSSLSAANRKSAFVQITFFERYVQKCEPPFKMLEIESQAHSNESLNEILTAQMCGTSKWNVAMTNGRLTVSLLK